MDLEACGSGSWADGAGVVAGSQFLLAESCIRSSVAESEFESDGFFAEPCSGSSVAESELGVRRLFGRAL